MNISSQKELEQLSHPEAMSFIENKQAPVVLIHSPEAAKLHGYCIAKLDDGQEVTYTRWGLFDSHFGDYHWEDKKIVFKGHSHNIVDVETFFPTSKLELTSPTAFAEKDSFQSDTEEFEPLKSDKEYIPTDPRDDLFFKPKNSIV